MVVFESRATDLVSLTDANGDGVDVFARDMTDHQTVLVSVRLAGDASANMPSGRPVISGDGRWVAFISGANDLVAEDIITTGNIYVRDLVAETTVLVSVAADGTTSGNDDSSRPVISYNGRWVVFESEATNLVDLPDNNGGNDLFVWDRETREVSLITVNAAGTAAASGFPGFFAPTIAHPLGQTIRVAFASTFTDLVSNDFNGVGDVFVRTLPSGPTISLSSTLADAESTYPFISASGSWVAFTSHATNLVANDLNGTYDCFVHDGAGVILVSRNAAGTASGNDRSGCRAVNPDRGFVVFTSYASDLVATDTNNEDDVFIRDIRPGVTSLVSANASGTNSANGYSFARDFLSVSANGRFVVFESYATDLEGTNNDAAVDIYVRDQCLGTTYLMNPNLAGTGSSNNEADHGRISSDGRWVTFSSRATDLVTIDNNGWIDTFRSEVPNWGDWGCGWLNIFSDDFESGDTLAWSGSVP